MKTASDLADKLETLDKDTAFGAWDDMTDLFSTNLIAQRTATVASRANSAWTTQSSATFSAEKTGSTSHDIYRSRRA